ncbi:ParB/RepB/Spo0J family partition protein [Herbaspirillum seropedicae]|uniref:ParB/RepB/Spo0J family partition protein n=1 Tax=Herbaspirillum seropedicae TaxID=964 RepID=UPI003F8D6840
MITKNKGSDRLRAKTAKLAGPDSTPAPAPASQAPAQNNDRLKTMPGALGAFRIERKELETKISELRAQLEAALNQHKGAFDAPLDELHIVPSRRRKLNVEQYAELKNNLATNKLVDRIVVRPRPEGGYEVISGSNRTTIYRELGRSTIPAILEEYASDAEAEIDALYANMFQNDLPDYAKYKNLKTILSVRGLMTHMDLANNTGMTRSHVSQLMIFNEMPAEVTDFLDEYPWAMGANIARDFDKLLQRDKEKLPRVIEALKKVASDELTQTAAFRWASEDETKQAKAKVKPVQIKAGYVNYCAVRHTAKSVRLDFQSDEEAKEMTAKLMEWLKQRAEAVKAAAAEKQ